MRRPVPAKKSAATKVSKTSSVKLTGASMSAASSNSSEKKNKSPKLRDIFEGAGFLHIVADNIHFTLKNRKGEIDHIFVWENVVLLCEETAASNDVAGHCTKKVFFHRIISQDWATFFTHYRTLNKNLDIYIGTKFKPEELEVRHIYYSEQQSVDPGVVNNANPFQILTRPQAAYFSSLVETIAKSARFEILKYLGISFNRIGAARISGSGVASNSFAGYAIPASHTNYPKGFAVVSFYADPMSLINRAYVLRREGWETPNLSYQRFVRSAKLTEMRQYLANNGKVFINNLIVTLPSKALMRDVQGLIVDPATFSEKTQVNLELQLELGTVGIVDGQHRILAYFEGDGPIEQKIESLRQRQNLLVTGIIFPPNYTLEMRVKFEAELFLTINNTQTGVNTQLKQDLETIINPETPLAIARSVVNRLSGEGPLADLLQVSQFDPPDKIATGSLGPYVLMPLVRKGSVLYKMWDPTDSQDLANAALRSQYVDYCFNEIKKLMSGVAENLKSKWKPVALGGVLSTIVVGGLMQLLGRLITVHGTTQALDYPTLFKPLEKFDFSPYTSSQWGKISKDMLDKL